MYEQTLGVCIHAVRLIAIFCTPPASLNDARIRFVLDFSGGAASDSSFRRSTLRAVQISSLPQGTPVERLNSRVALMPLLQARIDEVRAIRSSVELLPEVQYVHNIRVSWQPQYDLTAWHGGQDAYKCGSLFLAGITVYDTRQCVPTALFAIQASLYRSLLSKHVQCTCGYDTNSND